MMNLKKRRPKNEIKIINKVIHIESKKENQVTPPPKMKVKTEKIPVNQNIPKLKQLQKTKTKSGAVIDNGTHVTLKTEILVNSNFIVAYNLQQNRNQGYNYNVDEAIMKKKTSTTRKSEKFLLRLFFHPVPVPQRTS